MIRTPIIRVDPRLPDEAVLERAASILRGGGLVVFPTETVYGLGANALDAAAVARIFQAKGRPQNNPLIVHVTDATDSSRVVSHWPKSAQLLAAKFWPGPLTLVLPKHPNLPAIVTAGAPTVALRVPAHEIARRLIQLAGTPIAAPSANRSSELSPTTAEHVLAGLDGRVDLILDAGPAQVGLESTVLDLTTSPPRLLRPGQITPAQLEAIIGAIVRRDFNQAVPDAPLPSPGRLAKHYAPRTSMECLDGNENACRVEELLQQGLRVGWITLKPAFDAARSNLVVRPMPIEPAAYAAQLYAALHELDGLALDRIVVDLPPDTDEWLAVRDRIMRASAQD